MEGVNLTAFVAFVDVFNKAIALLPPPLLLLLLFSYGSTCGKCRCKQQACTGISIFSWL
jgi:hypothetical protein